MPTRPVKLPPKGVTLRSGPTLTVLDERSRKVAQLTGSYPIEIIRSADGYHVRDVRLQPYWVIISRNSAAPAGNSIFPNGTPAYAYSAYRLFVNRRLELEPEADLYFHRDTYPLIEMSENPDVPDRAVAYATPGTSGTHYEFMWAVGGLLANCDADAYCGTSNPCCVRLSDFFRVRGDGTCEFRDACICLTPQGLVIRDN